MSDINQIREKLIEHFLHPPKFKFEQRDVDPETYSFPVLTETGRTRLHSRGDGNRSVSSDALPEQTPKYPAGFNLLLKSLERASSRFRFASAPEEDWQHLRFSDDQLVYDRKSGFFEIRNSKEDTAWQTREPINTSALVADSWFELLCDTLVDDNFNHSFFLVGDPGCGKSTLIKYLLNRHFDATRSKGLIYCRFEFLKFRERWLCNGDFSSKLEEYLSFIQLRDLLINHFFDLHNASEFRIKAQFFGPTEGQRMPEKFKLQCAEISNAAKIEAERLGIMNYYNSMNELEHNLFELHSRQISLKNYLISLTTTERAVLIRILIKKLGNPKTVFILDGLDQVRYEEALNDEINSQLINRIIGERQSLGHYNHFRQIGFTQRTASIAIMRENTLNLLRIQRPHLRYEHFFFVNAISEKVATFNVIRRACRYSNIGQDSYLLSRIESNFMRGTIFALKLLMYSARFSPNPESKGLQPFDLFAGNLRELLHFINFYFRWTLNQLIRDRRIQTDDLYDIDRLLTILTSSDTSRFLRKKRYRIIELALLPQKPGPQKFQNACIQNELQRFFKIPRGTGEFRSNRENCGLVDNLFNYHRQRHPKDPDRHFLLEKIRILQLLSEQSMPISDTFDSLLDTFGYHLTDDEFEKLIIILMLNDLITTRTEGSEDGIGALVATAKAKIALSCLLPNMTYLEHVFHATLLPSRIVRHVNDKRRASDVLEWSISSIRNCFVLLAYIRFIESNNARGRPVPKRYRIWPVMSKSVISTVSAMLHQAGDTERAIASAAVERIDALVEAWKKDGLVS